MISSESKVNFASQTTEHGIDKYAVEQIRGHAIDETIYLLSEPTSPDKDVVGLSVHNHAPGVYEINIERGERTPAELAMLTYAAFLGVAESTREAGVNTSIFSLIDVCDEDLEEPLARRELLSEFDMKMVEVTLEGEMIMRYVSDSSKDNFSGTAAWVLHDSNINIIK